MSCSKWRVVYTKQGLRDKQIAYEAGFGKKIESIIKALKQDPFVGYPPFEKLVGDLKGAYSRRINWQHRVIYQVIKEEKKVKIISMWLHYE